MFPLNQSIEFDSLQSVRQIVTTNELNGVCERFGKKPSQRNRIVITRSIEKINNSGAIGATDRPSINALDQSAMKKLSETVRFNEGSVRSI